MDLLTLPLILGLLMLGMVRLDEWGRENMHLGISDHCAANFAGLY